MIEIEFFYQNNEFISFRIQGHANYDEYGKDIICSGVSAIALGGLNALKDDEFDIKIKNGLIEVNALKKISEYNSTVIQVIYIQLESLTKSYPKFVKLERKRK